MNLIIIWIIGLIKKFNFLFLELVNFKRQINIYPAKKTNIYLKDIKYLILKIKKNRKKLLFSKFFCR
jgi:hypothetical protein